MVHLRNDAVGHTLVRRVGSEQALSHHHKQGGRHTFTTDITDAEEKLIVAHEEVVEVASYFPGGIDTGIDIEIRALWKVIRQHRHLDITGNAQLTLYALFLSGHFLQLVVGLFQLTHLKQTPIDIGRQDHGYNKKTANDNDQHHPLMVQLQGRRLILSTSNFKLHRRQLS